MNNNTKAAKEARIERMKSRNQYYSANMTKAERAALPDGYTDRTVPAFKGNVDAERLLAAQTPKKTKKAK